MDLRWNHWVSGPRPRSSPLGLRCHTGLHTAVPVRRVPAALQAARPAQSDPRGVPPPRLEIQVGCSRRRASPEGAVPHLATPSGEMGLSRWVWPASSLDPHRVLHLGPPWEPLPVPPVWVIGGQAPRCPAQPMHTGGAFEALVEGWRGLLGSPGSCKCLPISGSPKPHAASLSFRGPAAPAPHSRFPSFNPRPADPPSKSPLGGCFRCRPPHPRALTLQGPSALCVPTGTFLWPTSR